MLTPSSGRASPVALSDVLDVGPGRAGARIFAAGRVRGVRGLGGRAPGRVCVWASVFRPGRLLSLCSRLGAGRLYHCMCVRVCMCV